MSAALHVFPIPVMTPYEAQQHYPDFYYTARDLLPRLTEEELAVVVSIATDEDLHEEE